MKTVLVSLSLLILMTATVVVHAATVGPNVEIAGEAFPDRQRVEPSIAVDPNNHNVIVSVAQDLRLVQFGGHRWHGVYRSADGGVTWSSNLLPGFPGDTSPQGLSSPLSGFKATSDPIVAFDLAGNAYVAGITTRFSLFVAKYVNDGADYSFTTLICSSACADKPWIAVDNSGGVNNGNVYITFDGGQGVELVRSTDGAQTFSSIEAVINNDGLSGVTVDPQGRVFVSGVLASSLPQREPIDIAVSTDGGQAFNGHEIAANIAQIPSPLPGNRFRTFTIPQIALTGQHFFSTIAVSGGVISVAWYDSRLGQLSNGTITGLDVFYASSTSGGNSFSTNLRVTGVSFNPNTVERTDFGDTQIFMGDYIQVAASPGSAHIIWADNRNACDTVDPTFGCIDQDVFTATITN